MQIVTTFNVINTQTAGLLATRFEEKNTETEATRCVLVRSFALSLACSVRSIWQQLKKMSSIFILNLDRAG